MTYFVTKTHWVGRGRNTKRRKRKIKAEEQIVINKHLLAMSSRGLSEVLKQHFCKSDRGGKRK